MTELELLKQLVNITGLGVVALIIVFVVSPLVKRKSNGVIPITLLDERMKRIEDVLKALAENHYSSLVKSLDELKSSYKGLEKEVASIDRRLTRIETKLENKNRPL